MLRANPRRREQIYKEYLRDISGINFSPRQIDVLSCLIHSRNQGKIAELLSIPSVRTVQTHIHVLKEKTNQFSTEHLVDMIDKSGKRKYFVEYYFNILVESHFRKTLGNILALTKRAGYICLIDNNQINKENRIVEQIKKHLKLININFVDVNTDIVHDVSCMLHVIEHDNFYKKPYNLLSPPHNAVILLDEGNNLKKHGFQDEEYVDFRNDSEYYFSLLKLAEKITNLPSIKQLAENFGETYTNFFNSWNGTENIKFQSVQRDIKRFVTSKVTIYLTVAFVISVITVYTYNGRVETKAAKYEAAKLYTSLGIYYQNTANSFEGAIESYAEAERIYGELGDGFKVVESLVKQGWCYFDVRKLDESLAKFQLALTSLGKNDSSEIKAEILEGISIIYDKKNIDSLKMHEQVYELYNKIHKGKDHSKVADALHNLGWYFRESSNNENLDKALDYLNKAFEMRKRLYANQDHLDIATSLNSLGVTYVKLGGESNLDKGLYYQNQALLIRKRNANNKMTQDIINSFFSLGKTHKKLGNYATAIVFFEKAQTAIYEIRQTYNYGPMIETFFHIGSINEAMNNEVESLEYYKKGYSIVKLYNINIEHPSTQMLFQKIKTLDEGFLTNSEFRLNILNKSTSNKYKKNMYNIKNKIKKLLSKLYYCSKNNTCGEIVITNELIGRYLEKRQNGIDAIRDFEIAKSLCFEAINMGIMSNTKEKRDYKHMLEFVANNRELIDKTIEEHPEYFVDGSLIIKCMHEGILSFNQMTNVLGIKQYKEWSNLENEDDKSSCRI